MIACHPLFFTLAWFVTLGNYYGHITIVFFMLIFGSPVLIRLFIGQAFNILIAFLLHILLGSHFMFECTITKWTSAATSLTIIEGGGFDVYQNPENRYINPLPFPSFDLQILFFTFTFMATAYARDEWRLNTENKHIYYRFTSLMVMFMFITTFFYFWFHTLWQVLFSAVFGSLLGMVWHRLTIRILHTMQPSQTYIYPNSSTTDDPYRIQNSDNNSTLLLSSAKDMDDSTKPDTITMSIPIESPRSSTVSSRNITAANYS